ncbi:MAG TPA: NAD(P)/FAD-dependent oxidoreductase [Nitrospira sp.]|nr:NAD(P)/FAD-dependent oxidoreductase [Nitrospira sp.]
MNPENPRIEAEDSSRPHRQATSDVWDVVIVGGGLAGLSAAIYLGRSRRRALLIDAGESMARWEPIVQNYLGFPEGLSGQALLDRGRTQVHKFGARTARDRVVHLRREGARFCLEGAGTYRGRRVLLATGLTHLLPDIPGADACLGRTVLFCKDCDAFRVSGKRIAIYGRRREAARYGLAMLAFSPSVTIVTDGRPPTWGTTWQKALDEYGLPVRLEPVKEFAHRNGRLEAIRFQDGSQSEVDALFATRGDVYHTALAEELGAAEDEEGQLIVDGEMRTTVPGLYAAGCVTPASCQMIIAAGQGATAAQAIDRDLFEESLQQHNLPCLGRGAQVQGALH